MINIEVDVKKRIKKVKLDGSTSVLVSELAYAATAVLVVLADDENVPLDFNELIDAMNLNISLNTLVRSGMTPDEAMETLGATGEVEES